MSLLRRVHPARCERHHHVVAGRPGGLLHADAAGQHHHVRQRDLLGAGPGVELLLHALQGAQHRGQPVRLVDLPADLRLEPDPAAVGAAALVAAAEGGGRRPRGGHQLGDRQPGGGDPLPQGGDVRCVDLPVVDRGQRVLPHQLLGRDLRADVAGDRAHVAVGQLEPGAGEGVREPPRGAPGSAGRSARRPGPGAARGRWSASSGRAAWTGRGRPGRCPLRRRPSASTGRRRPGSWSAPTRSRTASRRNCCPRSPGWPSRRPPGRW